MPLQRFVPKQVKSIMIIKPLKWIPANSYRKKNRNPFKQHSQTRWRGRGCS